VPRRHVTKVYCRNATYSAKQEHILYDQWNQHTFLTQRGNGKFYNAPIGMSRTLDVYNKFTYKRQHNKYLLDHTRYMFRPDNRSSSYLDPNTDPNTSWTLTTNSWKYREYKMASSDRQFAAYLGNKENPEGQYHTSLTAPGKSTVALIV
jgi:hypothetical protein